MIPSEKPIDNTTQNMLQMLWIDESDTLRKNKIFELITMKFAGMSDGDVLMGLMNLPSPIPQKSESFDLMKLFLIPLLQKINENPIDNLIKYQSLLSKNINSDSNSLFINVNFIFSFFILFKTRKFFVIKVMPRARLELARS